jgi:hypothetical protein
MPVFTFPRRDDILGRHNMPQSRADELAPEDANGVRDERMRGPTSKRRELITAQYSKESTGFLRPERYGA